MYLRRLRVPTLDTQQRKFVHKEIVTMAKKRKTCPLCTAVNGVCLSLYVYIYIYIFISMALGFLYLRVHLLHYLRVYLLHSLSLHVLQLRCLYLFAIALFPLYLLPLCALYGYVLITFKYALEGGRYFPHQNFLPIKFVPL